MATMATTETTVKPSGPRPSDKWIPWYIALFFTIMVAALVPMAMIAVKTMPGTVTENSYEKGLAYNRILATAAQEEKLGWQDTLKVVAPSGAALAQISYDLRDAAGQPIADAAVHVNFTRPVQGGMDREATLAAVGQGHYEGEVELPAHGVWDVRVSATRGADSARQNFQDGKRIVIE